MHKKTSRLKTIIAMSLGVIGVALLVVAGLGFWQYFQITHTGDDFPSSNAVTTSADVSEKPVVVKDEVYSVPADQPRVIKVSKLGIEGYVQKVGIDQLGAMATPNNLYFAGWYVNNPVPGEKGLSIINGHAGGRYSDGIFRNIRDLVAGDTVSVQMGDLSWRDFEVVKVETLAEQETATALFTHDPSIESELKLITCDGQFDDKTQTYDKRTIVSARLIANS